MTDILNSTEYARRKMIIDKKIKNGAFWYKKAYGERGALAETRSLAWYLLSHGEILGALSLMIEVRTEELNLLNEISGVKPAEWIWRRWRFNSKSMLRFYTALEKTLLFFGSL